MSKTSNLGGGGKKKRINFFVNMQMKFFLKNVIFMFDHKF